MNIIKTAVTAAAAIVLVFSLSACGGEDSKADATPDTSATVETTAPAETTPTAPETTSVVVDTGPVNITGGLRFALATNGWVVKPGMAVSCITNTWDDSGWDAACTTSIEKVTCGQTFLVRLDDTGKVESFALGVMNKKYTFDQYGDLNPKGRTDDLPAC